MEHSDIARAARSLSLRYAADDFQYEREFPGLRSTVMPMSTHVAVSPQEAADRLAIRELFDAYAHCADRRWLFSERQLLVDWTETRPSNP
ncbi:hypothetical protein DFR76_1015 [Nocardia pseudobrasiliensis]|uniref:SnoaL-like protein n=2 Tax=Nocardia pseudobrasiliensis TaxID=45979 RepID=A0A370ICX4_9NOCA|nr:hypothetical protein DFR76_1015 [Nocardia pseudobrasiliensis]